MTQRPSPHSRLDATTKPRLLSSCYFYKLRADCPCVLLAHKCRTSDGGGSLELMRAILGRQLAPKDILDLEDELETGNVILNSWVATVANLLKHASISAGNDPARSVPHL